MLQQTFFDMSFPLNCQANYLADHPIELNEVRADFTDKEWNNIVELNQDSFIGYDRKIYWRLTLHFNKDVFWYEPIPLKGDLIE